jgi:FAD/FMN-containing dehydrogenase
MMRGGALLPADMPIKQKAANVLLIELDGHPAAVEDERDRVGEICLDRGALDELVVTSESKRKDLWDKRRRSWTDLVEQTAYVSSLDPCVPLDKMAQFVGRVEEIKAQYGLTVYFSGHVGDGNLHVNFAADTDTPEIRQDIEMASGEILKLALSLGGTISGEHGIGYIKKKYVPLELSATSLSIQKKIKQVLDPLNIMNPEKIFPDSPAVGLKNG